MGKFKRSKDFEKQTTMPVLRHTFVGNINMYLQQKALIEKYLLNKRFLQKAFMHCTAVFMCDENP